MEGGTHSDATVTPEQRQRIGDDLVGHMARRRCERMDATVQSALARWADPGAVDFAPVLQVPSGPEDPEALPWMSLLAGTEPRRPGRRWTVVPATSLARLLEAIDLPDPVDALRAATTRWRLLLGSPQAEDPGAVESTFAADAVMRAWGIPTVSSTGPTSGAEGPDEDGRQGAHPIALASEPEAQEPVQDGRADADAGELASGHSQEDAR